MVTNVQQFYGMPHSTNLYEWD